MDRKEILKNINTIRQELAKDQLEIIKKKIQERKFSHHKSNRNFLMRTLIEWMRRRLMLEVELILEPLLDNQKEINLRFLEELNRLNKEVLLLKGQVHDLEETNVKDSQKSHS